MVRVSFHGGKAPKPPWLAALDLEIKVVLASMCDARGLRVDSPY